MKTKAILGGFVGHPKLLSERYKKYTFKCCPCKLDAIALHLEAFAPKAGR